MQSLNLNYLFHKGRKYHIFVLVPSGILEQFILLILQHWIANNVFGLAFSLSGIEMLHLNRYVIGSISSHFLISFRVHYSHGNKDYNIPAIYVANSI